MLEHDPTMTFRKAFGRSGRIVPRASPLPSCPPSRRRRAIFGPPETHEHRTGTAPAHPSQDILSRVSPVPLALDPAFAAAAALDRANEAWSAAYAAWAELMGELDPRGVHDWGDGAAAARAALGGAAGGMVAALAAAEAHMAELEAEEHAAVQRFRATTATSELGAAAMRAAARRYGRRPGGRAGDEAALMDT